MALDKVSNNWADTHRLQRKSESKLPVFTTAAKTFSEKSIKSTCEWVFGWWPVIVETFQTYRNLFLIYRKKRPTLPSVNEQAFTFVFTRYRLTEDKQWTCFQQQLPDQHASMHSYWEPPSITSRSINCDHCEAELTAAFVLGAKLQPSDSYFSSLQSSFMKNSITLRCKH